MVSFNYDEETMIIKSINGPQSKEWLLYDKEAFFKKYNDLDDRVSISQSDIDAMYDYGYQSEYNNSPIPGQDSGFVERDDEFFEDITNDDGEGKKPLVE